MAFLMNLFVGELFFKGFLSPKTQMDTLLLLVFSQDLLRSGAELLAVWADCLASGRLQRKHSFKEAHTPRSSSSGRM